MKPAIFLDIDGVLCIKGCRPGTFAPACVEALNWLTDAAAAQIVVSSTWRHYPDIDGILKRRGVTAKVIGITPDLSRGKLIKGSHTGAREIILGATRGSEIAAWLKSHAPRPFVILDDDDDMDGLSAHLVHTSYDHGLTRPLAELALRRLTR